jgi:ABC-2 type transport system permease protein
MLRAFWSEWTKFRRISFLIGAAAMSGFAVLGAYLGILRGTGGRFEALTVLHQLQQPGGLVWLLTRLANIFEVIALIIVAASFGAEYTQGTLRNLLVRESGRIRLLLGKYLAVLLFTLLATTLALAVGVGVALLIAPGHGLDTALWTSPQQIGQLVQLWANLLIVVTAYTVLGLLLALVFRSAAAAVGVGLAYSLVVEGLLDQVWSDAPQWLLSPLSGSITGANAYNTYGRALILVCLYAAIALIATGVLFRRRDVTS